MNCKNLLEVLPVTQAVSVVDGTRRTSGEAYKIATELPNCVLAKKVAIVRPTVATVGTVAIEIRLEVEE